MNSLSRKCLSCLLFLLVLSVSTLAQSDVRYALVIGNSNYPKEIGVLPNPVNDAKDMATELRNAQFDVQLVIDASYQQIRDAVRTFHDRLSNGPKDHVVGLFYYAGHGVQFQNENYLVPVDAKVQFEDDIVRMCFPVQRMVLANMERTSSRMNIVILDACRNSPFPATTRSLGNNGLGEIKNARGSFVAYATAPGSVASDGKGKNGLYTQELLKAMRTPGLLIEQVFKEVRRNVLHLSEERQYTWDSSNIIGDFYFIPKENSTATAAVVEEKPVVVATTVATVEPKKELTRSTLPKTIDAESLSRELTQLTEAAIPFKERQARQEKILRYFVVPYATTNIMIGPRIDERLKASKLLERLVTLPDSEVKVTALETSESGRIIELSVEIE